MDRTTFARQLRQNATPHERRLWHALRRKALGVKFRRQEPIGHYVVDFVSYEVRLVVELDGGQHAGRPRDEARDDWLRGRGFTVVRYGNIEVERNFHGIMEDINRRVGDALRAQL